MLFVKLELLNTPDKFIGYPYCLQLALSEVEVTIRFEIKNIPLMLSQGSIFSNQPN